MIFPLLKRIECYKRPLAMRLCHKKMFTSGTDILKMIYKAPDDHRLQLMTKTSTKSRKWCLKIVDKEFGNLLTWLEFHLETILMDHLSLRRGKSRLVRKFINLFEKERRVQACEAMLYDYQGVYKQIINGDESSEYRLDLAQ